MANAFIKLFVRTKLKLTSKQAACDEIDRWADKYLTLGEGKSAGQLTKAVRVPPMTGVDEDMRGWSYYELLAHNEIVNRSIMNTVDCLTRGVPVEGGPVKDAKVDVMPPENAGPEQVEAFRQSVDNYLAMVKERGDLHKTATLPHPIFGPYTAHLWHAMLGFHLGLHYPQAEYVVKHCG